MANGKWTREHFEALQREYLGDEFTKKDVRRMRILRAATQLFMEQGYRKTSVDEIARKAEVAKGTIYLHFDNKAALLMHAVALEKQVLFTRMSPLLDGDLAEEDRLHFYVRMMLTIARDLPLVARLMSGDNELFYALEDWDSEVLAKGQLLGEQWLMSLIEEAAPYEFDAAQRRERANVLLTLRWFTVMLLDERVRGGRSLDDLADTMTDVLVYGLVHRPPGQPDRLDEDEEEDEE